MVRNPGSNNKMSKPRLSGIVDLRIWPWLDSERKKQSYQVQQGVCESEVMDASKIRLVEPEATQGTKSEPGGSLYKFPPLEGE